MPMSGRDKGPMAYAVLQILPDLVTEIVISTFLLEDVRQSFDGCAGCRCEGKIGRLQLLADRSIGGLGVAGECRSGRHGDDITSSPRKRSWSFHWKSSKDD